jgi:hypothetical protein
MNMFLKQEFEAFLQLFTQWSQIAAFETTDDGSMKFILEIPAPCQADSSTGLILSNMSDGPTVAFDYCRAFFCSFIEENDKTGPAVDLITEFLEEKSVAVSWWNNEDLRWCSFVAPDEVRSAFAPRPFNRIRIRSWNGKFDSDIRF